MIKIMMWVPKMIKMIRGAKNDKDDMGVPRMIKMMMEYQG